MKRPILVISLFVVVIALCVAAYKYLPGMFKSTANGIITGRIGIQDVGPMMGGTVFFINSAAGPPPSPTRYWRAPTETFPLGANASFTASLPEGEYYMGAVERETGVSSAPPGEGEYYFISQDEKGTPKTYIMKKNEALDLGDLVVRAVQFRKSLIAKKGITSVEGTLRNENGVAAPGMLVFAFSERSRGGTPLFVSEKSGKNGNYILRLSGGGTYYLRASAEEGVISTAGAQDGGNTVSVGTAEAKKGVDIPVRTASTAASAH